MKFIRELICFIKYRHNYRQVSTIQWLDEGNTVVKYGKECKKCRKVVWL